MKTDHDGNRGPGYHYDKDGKPIENDPRPAEDAAKAQPDSEQKEVSDGRE